jgi:hypothetical protein
MLLKQVERFLPAGGGNHLVTELSELNLEQSANCSFVVNNQN